MATLVGMGADQVRAVPNLCDTVILTDILALRRFCLLKLYCRTGSSSLLVKIPIQTYTGLFAAVAAVSPPPTLMNMAAWILMRDYRHIRRSHLCGDQGIP